MKGSRYKDSELLFKRRSEAVAKQKDTQKNLILVGEVTGSFDSNSEVFIHLDGASSGGETDNGRYIVKNKKIIFLRGEVFLIENNFTDTGNNYLELSLFEGSTGGGGIGGGSWNELATGRAFNGNLTNGEIVGLGRPILSRGQIPMWAGITNGMGGSAKGFHILTEWEILEE
jgi:hypothetical protein